MKKSQERRGKGERRDEEWGGMGKDKKQPIFLTVGVFFISFCLTKKSLKETKDFSYCIVFLQKF